MVLEEGLGAFSDLCKVVDAPPAPQGWGRIGSKAAACTGWERVQRGCQGESWGGRSGRGRDLCSQTSLTPHPNTTPGLEVPS